MPEVRVQRLFEHSGHNGPVYAIEAGIEGVFFSGAADGIVAQWDSQSPKDAIGLMKGRSAVYCLHYISKKNWLIAGFSDGSLHVLDLKAKSILFSSQKHNGAIYAIAHDEHLFYSAGQDGKLVASDLDTGVTITQIYLSTQNLRFIQLTENKIFTGGGEGVVFELTKDALTPKQRWEAHTSTILDALYLGDCLLTVGRDAHLKRWILPTYELTHALPAHLMIIHSITPSPDAQYFITTSMDKTFKLWNTKQMKLLKVIDKNRHNAHTSSVNKSIWLPYNQSLITCSDDKSILQWAIDVIT